MSNHNKPGLIMQNNIFGLRVYDRNEGVFTRSIDIGGYHRGFSDIQFLRGSSTGWNAILVIKSS